jgi:hypothetical protein
LVAELVDRAGEPFGKLPATAEFELLPARLEVLLELVAVVLELLTAKAELPGGDDRAAEHGDAGKALEHGGAGVVLELKTVGSKFGPPGWVTDLTQLSCR